MKVKALYIFSFIFLMSLNVKAQRTDNIYRYSFLNVGGTARAIGGGGAFGALGGDFSTLSSNPAGLGAYIKNDFQISGNVEWKNHNTSFFNTEENSNRTSFKISNLGLVITTIDSDTEAKVVAKNFAIGFNNLSNYNDEFEYTGTGQGTIGRRLESEINGPRGFSPFFGELAAFNGLITDDLGAVVFDRRNGPRQILDTIEGQALFIIDPNDAILEKRQVIKRRGGTSEITLSGAANLSNKLYLGATVGIPIVRDESESFYSERDVNNLYDNFTTVRFQELEENNGAGANLKIGAIYRINKKVRIGGALHTPSLLFMNTTIETTLFGNSAEVVGNQLQIPTDREGEPISNIGLSPTGEFSYRLTTAPKALASAAFLIKRKGFISTDIEYVHYPSTRFFSSEAADDEFKEDFNEEIRDAYQGNVNVRISGERIFTKKIRGRLGFGYYGTPLKSNIQGDELNFSIGGSYRNQDFYIDAGYRLVHSTNDFVPTTIGFEEEFTVEDTLFDNEVVVTFGVRF